MNPNPFANNLQKVTDASDWESTKLPNLKELDSLQRCFICKEFLKAPVITSCNHTFCSCCIREYLVVDSHCPLCKVEQFESNLKRVILLEEIVLCYSKFRPILLELLKNNESSGENTKESKESSSLSPDITEESNGSSKRPAEDQEVIEISSDDSSAVSNTDSLKHSVNKRVKTEHDVRNTIPSRYEMVECPICSEKMSADLLQTQHIDYCLSGKTYPLKSKSPSTMSLRFQVKKKRNNTKSMNGISSFFKPPTVKPNIPPSDSSNILKPDNQNFYFDEVSKHHHNEIKKLPKLDFSSLTTPKLKEKLLSLKLPIQGTRVQLELRYNHYYILFNSNLDSNHPLSEKVLKQKLNQWEHSHLAFSSTSSNSSLFGSGSSLSTKCITDKDFSVKQWMDANKKEFKRLIRQAKASMKKNTSESPKNSPDTNVGDSHNNILPEEEHKNKIDNFDFKEAIKNNPIFTSEPTDISTTDLLHHQH